MNQEKANHYKRDKKNKTMILLLVVDVCICICVILAAWTIFLKEPKAVALAPDRAPEQIEPNQIPMEDSANSESASSTSENTESQKTVGVRFSKEVIVSLTNKSVTLSFGNGSLSVMDMVMQLVVQEQVLAQTGKLTPGNKVQTLDLVEGAAELLSEGEYDGQFRVFFYDPDTGEKSSLNNIIPITVTVQE